MKSNNPIKRIAFGAIAGLAGTIVIGVVRALTDKLLPAATPPIKDDPGEFMFDKAASLLPTRANRHIAPAAEQLASKTVLPFGYGMTFGALYAGLRSGRHSLTAD